MEKRGHFVFELANMHFCSSRLYDISYDLTLIQTIKHACRIVYGSPFYAQNPRYGGEYLKSDK